MTIDVQPFVDALLSRSYCQGEHLEGIACAACTRIALECVAALGQQIGHEHAAIQMADVGGRAIKDVALEVWRAAIDAAAEASSNGAIVRQFNELGGEVLKGILNRRIEEERQKEEGGKCS